jgi:hypothetical protein
LHGYCQSLSFCRRKGSSFYASKPFMKIRPLSTFICVSRKEQCVGDAAKNSRRGIVHPLLAACSGSLRLRVGSAQVTSHNEFHLKFHTPSPGTPYSRLCDGTCARKRSLAGSCDCSPVFRYQRNC